MEQGSRKRKSGKFRFAVSGSTINKLKRFLLNFIAVFLWLISLVIKLTVVRGLLLTRVCLYVGFTVARQRQWIGCLCCFISAMTRIWRSLTCSLKTPRARLVWVSTARCEAGIRAVKPRGSDATARAHAHHAKADASSSSSSSNVITFFLLFRPKDGQQKTLAVDNSVLIGCLSIIQYDVIMRCARVCWQEHRDRVAGNMAHALWISIRRCY